MDGIGSYSNNFNQSFLEKLHQKGGKTEEKPANDETDNSKDAFRFKAKQKHVWKRNQNNEVNNSFHETNKNSKNNENLNIEVENDSGDETNLDKEIDNISGNESNNHSDVEKEELTDEEGYVSGDSTVEKEIDFEVQSTGEYITTENQDEEALIKKLEERDERIKQANLNHATVHLADLWAPDIEQLYAIKSQPKIINAVKNVDQLLIEKIDLFQNLIKKSKTSAPENSGIKRIYKKLEAAPLVLKDKVYSGQGGTYFAEGLVVSPQGEGIYEAHNEKGFAHTNLEDCWLIQDSIAAYEDQTRKVAAYNIALKIGLQQITPPAVLEVLECVPDRLKGILGFNYISDRLDHKKYPLFAELKPNYRRLCAVQEKIENALTVYQFIEKFEAENGGKSEVSERMIREMLKDKISFQDYMLYNVWLMITGDNDGHIGNAIIYQDKKGKYGIQDKSEYRLMKIDEGQTFPRINKDFLNDMLTNNLLVDYSNASIDLYIRLIIENIKVEECTSILKDYGLEESITATNVRFETLKALIKEFPKISLRELWFRLTQIDPDSTSFVMEDNPCFCDLTEEEVEENEIWNPSPRKEKRVDFNLIKKQFKDPSLLKSPERNIVVASQEIESVKKTGKVSAALEQFKSKQEKTT